MCICEIGDTDPGAKAFLLEIAPKTAVTVSTEDGWHYRAHLGCELWPTPPDEQQVHLEEVGPDGFVVQRRSYNVKTLAARGAPHHFPAVNRLFTRMNYAWGIDVEVAAQLCQWLSLEWPQFLVVYRRAQADDAEFARKESARARA